MLKKRKKELAPSKEVCCEYCELGVDSRGGGNMSRGMVEENVETMGGEDICDI